MYTCGTCEIYINLVSHEEQVKMVYFWGIQVCIFYVCVFVECGRIMTCISLPYSFFYVGWSNKSFQWTNGHQHQLGKKSSLLT